MSPEKPALAPTEVLDKETGVVSPAPAPATGAVVPARPAPSPATDQPSREAIPSVPALRHDASFPEMWKGLSETPVTKEEAEILLAPVDPERVVVRDDGLVYVQWVDFVRRLNAAFGPMGWGLQPRGNGMMAGVVWYKGALLVRGRVVKEAVGEQKWQAGNARMTYPSAVEGAQSDCIVKCCKQLGMFSELWDKKWIDWFKSGEWRRPKGGSEGPGSGTGTTPLSTTPTPPGVAPPATGTNSDKITPAQMKAIHGYASKKGYDHQAVHDHCVSTFGCGLSGLDPNQASELIEDVKTWGNEDRP